MLDKIIDKIKLYSGLKLVYLLQGAIVITSKDSILKIDSSVKIRRVRIILEPYTELVISKNSRIKNAFINVKSPEKEFHIDRTRVLFGDNTLVDGMDFHISGTYSCENNNAFVKARNVITPRLVCSGNCMIGSNNRFSCEFWIRYNGKVSIGNYTNINEMSEVRCDEELNIGSYNQISYNVMIWDTNTHNIYKADFRRELSNEKWLGYEFEKPKTKKVLIGNDCWIGKNCTILKGTIINDKCIIGYHTLINGTEIPLNSTVVQNVDLKIFNNEI